jgi:excisionase family DNA binding protein
VVNEFICAADMTICENKEDCPVWTVREAAAYLGSSRNHVFTLIHSGALPFQRMGKRFVLPRAAVEQLLQRGWTQNGK